MREEIALASPFWPHTILSISKCIVPLQMCTSSIMQKSSPGGRFIGAAPETSNLLRSFSGLQSLVLLQLIICKYAR